MITKICVICGAEFEARDKRTTCCKAHECRRVFNKLKYQARRREYTCKKCGMIFFATDKQLHDTCPKCVRGKGTYNYKEVYTQEIVCRQCGIVLETRIRAKTNFSNKKLAVRTCEVCKRLNAEATSVKMKLQNPSYQSNFDTLAQYELAKKQAQAEKELKRITTHELLLKRMHENNPMSNPETVEKVRQTTRERRALGLIPPIDGTKRINYKGTRGTKQYIRIALKPWILSNLERTDYTCEVCNQRGGLLHVHHLEKFSDIVETFARQLNLELTKIVYLSEEYKQLEQLVVDYHNTHNIGLVVCEDCHSKVDNCFHKRYGGKSGTSKNSKT